MIEVRRVEGSNMMKDFIMLPWERDIYQDDPAWVPPLIRDQKRLFDRKKGYFFEIGEAEFFLAYKNGVPAGRITAQVNHLYEQTYDRETGFFGFYESVNDGAVACALFDAASLWLKEKGKKIMNGPQSFSIYDSVGFEVEGEDKMPTVGLFHFAPYYRKTCRDMRILQMYRLALLPGGEDLLRQACTIPGRDQKQPPERHGSRVQDVTEKGCHEKGQERCSRSSTLPGKETGATCRSPISKWT